MPEAKRTRLPQRGQAGCFRYLSLLCLSFVATCLRAYSVQAPVPNEPTAKLINACGE